MRTKAVRSRLGLCCMAVGILLVAAALALLLWNLRQANQAQQAAQQSLEQVKEEIAAPATSAEASGPTMKEVDIDGKNFIGYLSIPALDLELPVQSQWDYNNLKTSPCRYYGAAKTNDLVIAAHNYTRHFGHLSQLTPGDLVYFTDMDGITACYQVEELDVLEATAVEEMTDGGYALTLFTCTYGGKSRMTVRCVRAADTQQESIA